MDVGALLVADAQAAAHNGRKQSTAAVPDNGLTASQRPYAKLSIGRLWKADRRNVLQRLKGYGMCEVRAFHNLFAIPGATGARHSR